MKKILLFSLMAAMAVSADAQIVSSNTSMTKTTVVSEPRAGWSAFNLEYIPFKFSGDDTKTWSGFGFSGTNATSITNSVPLFFEYGFGMMYVFGSEKDGGFKTSVSLMSFKVPLNLAYDFQIPNTKVHIDPFVGLNVRLNLLGEIKYEYGSDEYKIDMFKKDEGDGSRFNFGWHIGAKVRLDKFMIGAQYGTDFSEILKECKARETVLSLGFCF